jgi:hypothetical protein
MATPAWMNTAAANISGGNVTSIQAAPKVSYPNSPTLSYIKQSNVPVAQYSQTPLKQVNFSGVVSPNLAAGASALPPDRNVYYSLVQQQQELTNAQNALNAQYQLGGVDAATYRTQAAKLSSAQQAVAADITTYQKNLQTYQGSDIRTQAMLASVITGYKENSPQFSNPQDVWTHSSLRVFKDGVWQTLPEAYATTYGGDPYADVASTPFLQLSMADALRSSAEAAAHKAKLLIIPEDNPQAEYETLAPVEYEQIYPDYSYTAASAPSGPTVWDMIAPYATFPNMVKALVVVVIVIIVMRMMGSD